MAEPAAPGPRPRLAPSVEAALGLWQLVWDPAALPAAARDGQACVACGKRWPRPRAAAGRLPDGARVYACEECAATLTHAHIVTGPTTGPASTPAAAAGSP
jgi:hypothetical protein